MRKKVKTSIIYNHDTTHARILNEGISGAEEIIVYVAFLKVSGLSKIRKSLLSAIKRGSKVRFVIGLDMYVTEPQALYDLARMIGSKRICQLLLVEQGAETFHPKFYYWRKGNHETVMIGSANITAGGLSTNHELSILHNFTEDSPFKNELSSFLNRINSDARLVKANRPSLSQYEKKYKIYSEKRK